MNAFEYCTPKCRSFPLPFKFVAMTQYVKKSVVYSSHFLLRELPKKFRMPLRPQCHVKSLSCWWSAFGRTFYKVQELLTRAYGVFYLSVPFVPLKHVDMSCYTWVLIQLEFTRFIFLLEGLLSRFSTLRRVKWSY